MNLFLAGTTETFGRNHIICLIVSLILIIVGSIAVSKSKLTFNNIINIMLIVWIVSELTKMTASMSYLVYNSQTGKTFVTGIIGYVKSEGDVIRRAFLPRGDLPLHLCSIQPIFILIVKFTKSEKVRNALLQFMFPTCIVGAILALALDTIGADFKDLQLYEYFIFHTCLTIFAISIYTKKATTFNLKSYFTTVKLLVVMFVSSIWINSILSDTKSLDNALYTNFFYSSKPPLSNLPILNLDHGWFVYFIHMLILGLILMTLFYLPFIIKEIKLKKSQTAIND